MGCRKCENYAQALKHRKAFRPFPDCRLSHIHCESSRIARVPHSCLCCRLRQRIWQTSAPVRINANYPSNINSMLQCVPHIKLQTDVKVSLWMKRIDCILIPFSTVLSTMHAKSSNLKIAIMLKSAEA